MKRLTRVLVCALLGTLGVVVAGTVLAPQVLGETVFAGDVPAVARLLLGEAVRGEALAVRSRQVMKSLEGKQEAITALLERRQSLIVTVERFRELGALLDDGQDDVLGPVTAPHGDEALIRDVLRWADQALRGAPNHDEVLRRLQEEAREVRYGEVKSGPG